MAPRFTIKVSDDLNAELNKYSDEFAISKGQFSAMCIKAGLGVILRAVKPEEAISPETMAKIVKEVEKLNEEIEKDQK